MTDATPQKRVLPARERRESTAKRRASSPMIQKSPTTKTNHLQPASETRQKRKYTKRASLIQAATPTRSTSTPVSAREESLPTRVAQSAALPTSQTKQASALSNQDYQSIADSAILTASLHRSRMQWLCDGVLQKYWTKPVKKKGVVDVPPNNPDAKSMQKLGNATITIEPHTFEATLFTVRDPTSVVPAYYRHPNQHTVKQGPPPALPTPPAPYAVYHPPAATPEQIQQSVTTQAPAPAPRSIPPSVKQEKTPTQPLVVPPPTSKTNPPPAGSSSAAQSSKRPPTPPGGAKTTDPVIQMLAARAASDNRLKELMKVVATSRATAEQLREFQAHIDEFNSIVKRQEEERERQKQKQLQQPASTATPSRPIDRDIKPPITSSTQTTAPAAAHPAAYGTNPARGPPPLPPYVAYPAPPPPPPPRVEPVIKHIVIEFNSAASSTQPASSDRWLFPEHAVLDMRYGGMEMTCSFLVEKKGADLLAAAKAIEEGEGGHSGPKWEADKEYYQPVTMIIKATQHRTIETIARSAKSLADVQKYMKEVMEKKVRARQEYLVLRLPREKATNEGKQNDFVDSAIELSAEEDDDLKDFYGVG